MERIILLFSNSPIPGEYALFYTALNEGGKKAASVFNIDPVSWDEAWCFTVE